MAKGYTTLEDLRRALQKAELPGDISQDKEIAVDAIAAQTEPLEKTFKRHWYASTGDDILDDASEITIPTGPETRDDEHDIQTHGGMVHGAGERDRHRTRKNSDALLEAGPRYERRRRNRREPKQQIRVAIGEPADLKPPIDETVPVYTRIQLARKDIKSINELHVINENGAYDDWVAESEYDGGVGKMHRGKDYWVRVNNGGVSELYLNVHAMDDDIASLSNAVYVDLDYGHEGIPRNVRRAVAFRAASDFVEEAAMQIPENAKVYNVDTLAEEFERKADELLEVYK